MWQWPQEVRLNVYLLVYHAKWGIPAKLLKRMAGTTGLEPAASAVTGQRPKHFDLSMHRDDLAPTQASQVELRRDFRPLSYHSKAVTT